MIAELNYDLNRYTTSSTYYVTSEYVQVRKHKSKRINKKWLKRYGEKLIVKEKR